MEREYKTSLEKRLIRRAYYANNRARILSRGKERRRACARVIPYLPRGGGFRAMSGEQRAMLSQGMREMWARIRGGR